MEKMMRMKSLFLSMPEKMLNSSCILRQLMKLKSCSITKQLKMKVKCREFMPVFLYISQQSLLPVIVIIRPLRTVPPIMPFCHFHSGWSANSDRSRESMYSGMKRSPAKTSTIMIRSWNADCPRICFIILLETICSCLLLGLRRRSSQVGISVASAREARVSMMRLIHSIWIGARICCLRNALPMRVIRTATMLTVIWNCINFLIESQIFLPHITAFTIELKLSSSRIISAASRATSVPEMPIAKPTSAFLRAGASLVPSPVTATTSPRYLSPVTRAYLSSGRERASTRSLSLILSNYSAFLMVSIRSGRPVTQALFIFLAQSQMAVLQCLQTTPPISYENSVPSMTRLPSLSLMMPTSLAMARAVIMLSPVTILTLIPARWHLAIASGTSLRGMSLTPKMQINTSPFFQISNTPLPSLDCRSSPISTFLQARQRVLSDDSAIFMIFSCIFSLRLSDIISTLLLCMSYHLLQQPSTISEAPFTKMHCYQARVRTTDILLRAELKGHFSMVGYFSRQSLQLTPFFCMNSKRAISVEEPFSSGRMLTVLLTHVPILKSSIHSELLVQSQNSSLSFWVSIMMVDPFQNSVRVILFMVRVPVLSEQMLLASPIVSQAYILRTKLLSVSICFTETARESVTERGSPSGTATTMTVMERMKQPMSSLRSTELCQDLLIPFQMEKRISRTSRMVIAEQRPNFPISDANFSNFSCNGVMVYHSWVSRVRILPMHERSPTTKIIIFPQPVRIFVPLKRIGLGISYLQNSFSDFTSLASFNLLTHISKVFL